MIASHRTPHFKFASVWSRLGLLAQSFEDGKWSSTVMNLGWASLPTGVVESCFYTLWKVILYGVFSRCESSRFCVSPDTCEPQSKLGTLLQVGILSSSIRLLRPRGQLSLSWLNSVLRGFLRSFNSPCYRRPAFAAGCFGTFGKSNLVDPASSHMLVSKIKPCMSKYKYFTAKLWMAHYNSYYFLAGRFLHGYPW